MGTVQEKKEKLYRLVDNLPPDRLDAAEVLREQFQRETRVAVKDGKLIVRLGGLWKGVEITEEDIAVARHGVRVGDTDMQNVGLTPKFVHRQATASIR